MGYLESLVIRVILASLSFKKDRLFRDSNKHMHASTSISSWLLDLGEPTLTLAGLGAVD